MTAYQFTTHIASTTVLTSKNTVSQIVIPARLASTRLPEKLLLRETGKPLIQHTYESALAAIKPNGITIAVDSDRLFEAVRSFGGNAMMTDPALPSGTDRVAVVAQQMPEVDIFVNVQGDEPEIFAAAIDQVIELLECNPSADVATLACPIRERERLDDPACVKVFVMFMAERSTSVAVPFRMRAVGMKWHLPLSLPTFFITLASMPIEDNFCSILDRYPIAHWNRWRSWNN